MAIIKYLQDKILGFKLHHLLFPNKCYIFRWDILSKTIVLIFVYLSVLKKYTLFGGLSHDLVNNNKSALLILYLAKSRGKPFAMTV